MLKKVAKEIAAEFFNKEDFQLESAIGKYASEHSLNNHQASFLTTHVNRSIISEIQRGVATGDYDPHFTFPTAKVANVIGILRPKTPGAEPRLPGTLVTQKPVLVESVTRPDRSQETLMGFVANPQSIPDRAIGLGVLSYLKEKMKKKKSYYTDMCYKLETMIGELEKQAQHKLLSGTPVEVFEKLPVKTAHVVDQLEEWGHKLKHIDDHFELDHDDEVVKLAFQICEVEKLKGHAKAQLHDAQTEYDKVKEIVNDR